MSAGRGQQSASEYTLADYRHASRTFVSDQFANAPKFKWLFHVYFSINQNLVTNSGQRVFPETKNYGLMVKSADLPKFQVTLQELNQYNRKRYIQQKINYEPVRISFHDDNDNTIRNLWFTYYNYYFFDPAQPNQSFSTNNPNVDVSKAVALNRKNVYQNEINPSDLRWGYSGDINNSYFTNKQSFFNHISIFGFNQHHFAQYQLINPIIENFSHDSYNYAEGTGTMENQMTLRYESVKYYQGDLNGLTPDQIVARFGEDANYELDPSPITIPGAEQLVMTPGGYRTGGQKSDLANSNLAINYDSEYSAIQRARLDPQKYRSPLIRTIIPGFGPNPSQNRNNTVIPATGAQNNTLSQVQNSTGVPNQQPSNTATDEVQTDKMKKLQAPEVPDITRQIWINSA
jgi:hypothetical protein